MLNTLLKFIGYTLFCFVIAAVTLLAYNILLEVIEESIPPTYPLLIKWFYGLFLFALFIGILYLLWRALCYLQTPILSSIVRGGFLAFFVCLSVCMAVFTYISSANSYRMTGYCADSTRYAIRVELADYNTFLVVDNHDLWDNRYIGWYIRQESAIYFICLHPYPKIFTGTLSPYPVNTSASPYFSVCGCQSQEGRPFEYQLSLPGFSHECLGMKENKEGS